MNSLRWCKMKGEGDADERKRERKYVGEIELKRIRSEISKARSL